MLKRLKRLAFSRVFIVGILIALQFFILFYAAIGFTKYFVFYYVVSFLLACLFVLRIVHSPQNMAYKLAWTVLVLIFPLFGASVYTIFAGNQLTKYSIKKMRFISEYTCSAVGDNGDVLREIEQDDPMASKQSRYLRQAAMCPPYRNGETSYYKTGEEWYPYLLQALEKAEHYIFLEYFIIEEGEMWGRIHDILRRKVQEGVDVRIIYDDIGCILTLNRKFARQLEAEGIQCRVFHRFIPVLSARQNNRDHRKICVIDGTTAFTGGINLADEYINRIEKHGYWKDNAVLLRGEAAWSFTVMFLTMWDYLNHEKTDGDYSSYKPDVPIEKGTHDGYVQPYTDNPLDGEPVGENVYLNLIESAMDYVWITTPYLIIDERMEHALCKAVSSGVDVRILTPGIPDKRMVNETTKSYYPNLIRHGVRIYEYTPGFLHAKTFLCDDKTATVGSVNLDYRSFYLHFECGVWMYKTGCISKIKEDFEEMFAVSREIREVPENRLLRQLFRGLLELFAPLM